MYKTSHLTHEYISYLGYKSPPNSENKRLNNFQLLGKRISLKNPSLDLTLIQFLRNDLGLCGTKLACGEGSCGACTVTMARPGIKSMNWFFTVRPKWSSSKTSISMTSTTKTSTFYPKTSTGKNIYYLKHRLAITSIN